MQLRVIVGATVSAGALLLWSLAFWVLIPAPEGVMQSAADEAGLIEALRAHLPASASYVLPLPPSGSGGPEDGPAVEAFRQRQMAGPVAVLHFSREGIDPLSPLHYLKGFAHLFAASLLAALLLLATLPKLEGYAQRVVFVCGLGLFAAVAVRLYDPLWWHLPWGYFLYLAAFDVSSWLVAGIVLAGIVKPTRGVQHLTDPSKPLWKRALEVD